MRTRHTLSMNLHQQRKMGMPICFIIAFVSYANVSFFTSNVISSAGSFDSDPRRRLSIGFYHNAMTTDN